MKKTMLIAALTLVSGPAFASKARLTALGNSAHLSDTYLIFSKPDTATKMGEWANLEFGPDATPGNNPNAEGGFVRMAGENAWGAYLGYTPAASAFRAAGSAAAAGHLKAENGLNLFYASKANDMGWGLNFFNSMSENKVAKKKQAMMGLNLSASADMWDAQLGIGLSNTAENTATAGSEHKFTGKTTLGLSGGYWMDSMYLFGKYTMGGFKHETGPNTNEDDSRNTIELGVVNSHKKDGTDFFYGAKLVMENIKNDKATGAADDTKTTNSTMPVWFGLEAEAASWLVLRGSISQNLFLMGSKKTETNSVATTETVNASDTAVNAGLGMKWNKWMFDGTLTAAKNGNFGLDGANFLANGSLTYMF